MNDRFSVAKLRQEHEVLRSEYQVCKQKLDSKCEALLILTHDLDKSRQERDQFKLMAEQVQQRYQTLKRQLAGVGPRANFLEQNEFSNLKHQNLAQMLSEMRECNKTQQIELEDLRQKLKDAQGDVKLLREQIVRQRVGTTDEGISTRHFPAHEREDLVQQLETAREQITQLERDVQQIVDEKEEQETERDVYKNKFERLNQEVNYILKGDENRIVDIDALVMENKFLQKRIDQMQEEKSMAMATVSKYKSLLERKKSPGILKLGQSRAGGVVISQRQVKELLSSHNKDLPTQQMLSDVQSLATALLETVNDKNLALQHQRKTNKILGSRVSELEKKLKTLEVSGLWSTTGKPVALEKLRVECEEIKTLIPNVAESSSSQTSIEHADSDDDETQASQSPLDDSNSESSINSSSNTPSHATKSSSLLSTAHISLEDLDFLPTRENDDAIKTQPHIVNDLKKGNSEFENDNSNTNNNTSYISSSSVSVIQHSAKTGNCTESKGSFQDSRLESDTDTDLASEECTDNIIQVMVKEQSYEENSSELVTLMEGVTTKITVCQDSN